MFFLLCLVGIFGQVSASPITDFLLKVVGTYEGELSWDDGSTAVTTTIILEGNSISGTSIYPNGASPRLRLSKLYQKREN